MSKGVINSITLDKTVILKDENAKVTVDYEASGSDVFTLDDFVNPPSYLQNITVPGGVEQQKLTANDAASYDDLGHSVAISGNYAIVGAPGDSTGLGAAYIFKNNGTSWEHI